MRQICKKWWILECSHKYQCGKNRKLKNGRGKKWQNNLIKVMIREKAIWKKILLASLCFFRWGTHVYITIFPLDTLYNSWTVHGMINDKISGLFFPSWKILIFWATNGVKDENGPKWAKTLFALYRRWYVIWLWYLVRCFCLIIVQ